ncbi:hypothetical protein B0H14DRAFT_3713311 [Mycena olivaceomarginata]|nr:hypothetical protein B0H14DRAFT_3713311 [Mycena olivaceomarginata]
MSVEYRTSSPSAKCCVKIPLPTKMHFNGTRLSKAKALRLAMAGLTGPRASTDRTKRVASIPCYQDTGIYDNEPQILGGPCLRIDNPISVPLDILHGQRILEHCAAHLLYDSSINRQHELCGLCMRPSADARLLPQKANGNPQIDWEKSTCKFKDARHHHPKPGKLKNKRNPLQISEAHSSRLAFRNIANDVNGNQEEQSLSPTNNSETSANAIEVNGSLPEREESEDEDLFPPILAPVRRRNTALHRIDSDDESYDAVAPPSLGDASETGLGDGHEDATLTAGSAFSARVCAQLLDARANAGRLPSEAGRPLLGALCLRIMSSRLRPRNVPARRLSSHTALRFDDIAVRSEACSADYLSSGNGAVEGTGLFTCYSVLRSRSTCVVAPSAPFVSGAGGEVSAGEHWVERLLARAKDLKAERRTRTPADIAVELQKWLDEQPGDKRNPLLDLPGLDPSQDTPVELLHTVLLGVMKYIWHFLNTSQWSDTDRHLLAVRLQSTDITGLTIPPLRAGYMIQYRNNLVGKHFKSLMQILVFHAHKICTPDQFRLIQTAGDLGARLWVPEIDNMDQYLAQLNIAIANLLDAFDVVDPLRILVKIKLHLLAHIPDDIRRFGPAIRFATEIYEAYNGVFRLCSIYSNHRAPSRDISLKFASMSRVKHYLSGGYWRSLISSKWIQAGGAVQRVLQDDPVFQRHLGWVPPADITPAFVKTLTGKRRCSIPWKDTIASCHWQQDTHPAPDGRWESGQYVVAQSGDRASTRSWVFALHSGKTIIGRIKELLVNNTLAIVTLERFMLSSQRHPDFLWPILRRPTGTEITEDGVQSFLPLDAASIQFLCSVQHDCRRGDCQPSAVQKHHDDDHFILNLGGFHNFVHICRVLPSSLTDLKPLFEDRVAFHKSASAKAQRARKNQRKRTAARKRETAQAKKREAELAAAEAEEAERAAEEAERAAEEAERAAAEAEEGQATEQGGNPENDTQDPIGPAAGASEDDSDSDSDVDEIDMGDDGDSEYLGPQTRGRKRKRRRVGQ